ncbi:MAG: CDP-glycerol glycerophosphotransferase family protein [Propionibacteriaceae bacterium]
MTQLDPAAPDAVRFSIITAVYNVSQYLGDFIAAIDAQTFPLDRFEVIAVNDGSTDSSLSMLEEWAARRPGLVTIITKENGGQSTARNRGLDVARGEWVTFTDPDDVIESDYLAEVDAFLLANPQTQLLGTNRIMLNDSTGVLTDNHPLRMHFRSGNRLRNIDELPKYFHGTAPAAFFKLATLNSEGLRFDPQVRPNFEDGHLCCRYLLAGATAAVGFVSTARYHYRKRGDLSSTLQTSLTNPDRYTNVLRYGYLALLKASSERTGQAPEWLQNYVLYELSWYFSSQDTHTGGMTAAKGAVSDEFHELLAEITTYLGDDVIAGFDIRPLKRVWKEILLHSYRDESWHNPYVVIVDVDHTQGLVKLSYNYTGEPPREEILGNGKPMRPKHAKIHDISYHGRTLLYERIAWVPLRVLRMRLNGQFVDLRASAPGFPVHTRQIGELRRMYRKPKPLGAPKPKRRSQASATPAIATRSATEPPKLSFEDKLVARLAGTPAVRRMYGGAWVLMDRIHDSDDSAERLFRYLRARRRGINAWFVVEEGTPDWNRLKAEGYLRVVAHGSFRWKLLMANCEHLISSHADVPVMAPPAILAFTKPRWHFTFLQHGVIKDDLSEWLNRKKIDLFITSTQGEYDSIAGDHTPYTFTSKETKLTGLPRFDRLREKGQQFGPQQRDLVLIAPTWRNWLVPSLAVGTQKRTIKAADFLATDYAKKWMAVLRSPELARAAEERGLTIGFLPHPNVQSVLDELEVPPHVKAFTYYDNDVQELFARSALFVTDYSSIAFNAAYIDRPSVYFQFDSELVLNGGHVGRRGYFDYERDGFGPVTYDVDSAVRAMVDGIAHGPQPTPDYQQRIDATFPLRDGKCCERVTREIQLSGLKSGAKLPKSAGRRAPATLVTRVTRRARRIPARARAVLTP